MGGRADLSAQKRDLDEQIYVLRQSITGMQSKNFELESSNKLTPILGLATVGIVLGLGIGLAIGGFAVLPLVLGACAGGMIGSIGGKFISGNMIDKEKNDNIAKISANQINLENLKKKKARLVEMSRQIEQTVLLRPAIRTKALYNNNIQNIMDMQGRTI